MTRDRAAWSKPRTLVVGRGLEEEGHLSFYGPRRRGVSQFRKPSRGFFSKKARRKKVGNFEPKSILAFEPRLNILAQFREFVIARPKKQTPKTLKTAKKQTPRKRVPTYEPIWNSVPCDFFELIGTIKFSMIETARSESERSFYANVVESNGQNLAAARERKMNLIVRQVPNVPADYLLHLFEKWQQNL